MNKVFVYWNLTRGLWSVKAMDGPERGRVVARAPELWLDMATAKVSEAGRQRVLREGRKNVHAGILGYRTRPTYAAHATCAQRARDVSYNPYKGPDFVYRDTGLPVDWSPDGDLVYLGLGRQVSVYRRLPGLRSESYNRLAAYVL